MLIFSIYYSIQHQIIYLPKKNLQSIMPQQDHDVLMIEIPGF
jgi:hypothetical protein